MSKVPERYSGPMPGRPNVFADFPDLTGNDLYRALAHYFGKAYARYEVAFRALVAHCYECEQCHAAKVGREENWCEVGAPLAGAWYAEWVKPDFSV